MTKYVHLLLLACLFAVGCQRQTGTEPATTGSADRTAPSQGGTVEIPSGTQFYLRFDKALDSAKVKQGDLVTAELDQPIVAGGRDVLPKGTKFGVRVTNVQLAKDAGTVGLLTFNIETAKHGGADYQVKALPVTVETSPLKTGVNPNAVIPHTPVTEKEGRANAVLRRDQALL